jgi:hypothetical protein
LSPDARADSEGRLGEIEGIDLTLTFLRDKRSQTERTHAGPSSPSACPVLKRAEQVRVEIEREAET